MITKQDIKKLATLVRIEVAEDEIESLQQDMERVLSYVDKLNRAETSAVDPLKNVMGLENIMRSDNADVRVEADASRLVEAAFASDAGYVKVPPVKDTWS